MGLPGDVKITIAVAVVLWVAAIIAVAHDIAHAA